ncbi:Kcnh1 [Symbiodinium natans]|uniref:Kcnh1 protein n=1 Tax=Symbiodinium natans TaxID=878477 RepID=A0A812MLY5_9DINO|nr:Kcnh1 [Symbiodinium natans]
MTTQLNRAAENKKNQFRQLRKYLIQNRIDDELGLRITGFLENAFDVRQAAVLESQVELLGFLSKPLTAELQYAKYERCLKELIIVKQHSKPDAYDFTTLQIMKNLANDGLTHRTFAPADTVFEAETMASHAYFMTAGSLKYVLHGEEAKLSESWWLVEMCMWIHWTHLGEMKTEDATGMVLLEADRFSSLVRVSPNGQATGRAVALQVVDAMNMMEVLTDLWQCPVQYVSESSPGHSEGRRFFRKLLSADLAAVVPTK